MATYAIEIIPGGFDILADGVLWVRQTTWPGRPGNEPIPDDERQAVAEAYLESIKPPPPPPVVELVLTSITPDAQHAAQTVVRGSEVTCPVGTTLTVAGEVRAGAAVVPVDGIFRVPVRATDGRERVVLATITQGLLASTWCTRESGIWEVTETLINRDLPVAQRMRFAGLKGYVLEA